MALTVTLNSGKTVVLIKGYGCNNVDLIRQLVDEELGRDAIDLLEEALDDAAFYSPEYTCKNCETLDGYMNVLRSIREELTALKDQSRITRRSVETTVGICNSLIDQVL